MRRILTSLFMNSETFCIPFELNSLSEPAPFSYNNRNEIMFYNAFSMVLGEFVTINDLPYLWSNEDTNLDLCLQMFWKEILDVIESNQFLVKSCNKLFHEL